MKFVPKEAQKWPKWGSGAGLEPNGNQNTLLENAHLHFGGHFEGHFGNENLIVFSMLSKRRLFDTLGTIRELMGGKVMPKGAKKGSKRDHFEVRVGFWKWWFYPSKTIILEVLEVFGDGLETLSEMKATKRALERCLRLPFCRFDEILEILRVPVGSHFRSKNWTFFWFDFWSILRSILGGAGGRGGPPLSLKNLRS